MGMGSAGRLLAGALALVATAAGAIAAGLAAEPGPMQEPRAAGFVGSQTCSGCHGVETKAWHGSHHDLAMAEATDTTVLGDFNNATFSHAGVTSRFFKRDGRFFVNTEGADGKLADFQIRYTFGVTPLQQYLIAFPDGRLQALGIAWDSRPKDKGGQRWYHLYSSATPNPGDPLHWTGLDQTWNFQCAECHSTELRKNYDAIHDSYATTWAEIDVGCEACHGPGAAHVQWAQGDRQGANGLAVHFDERKDISWILDPATGNSQRSAPRTSAKELETCGVCHSRGTKIAEPWRPGEQLLQTHVPTLISPGLFEADGKMLDEVYNYTPFRQSKMFMAGVSCSDCHNPHSLKLVAEGDAVCGQCHDLGKYAVAAHHHHAETTEAARCVSCHMPKRTYMGVDPRHDHGFRIPRPDESARFGTTNACNDCHTEKDAAWASAAIDRWYGPDRPRRETWTEAFAAARAGKPEAATLLLRLAESGNTPSMVRATALESLGDLPSRDTATAAKKGLADADPLVRLAALRTLRAYPVEVVWSLANPLLADPVRAVRSEAAALLAPMPADRLAATDRTRLTRAIDDYIAAQQVNADRPEHRVNLGNLYAQQRRFAEAEIQFAAARKLDPGFAPAYVGLSQAYASQGRDGDGERVLREGLARMADDAELHHALGLNLVRQRRPADALSELGRAASVDPANARFVYVYAIALNTSGRSGDALTALEASHSRHPTDRDTLYALVTISRDAGRADAALAWAKKLAAIDPAAQPLVDRLSAPTTPLSPR
ncbi:MAG: multiheme c-type cytochrome [Rhodospirillales bacterium]